MDHDISDCSALKLAQGGGSKNGALYLYVELLRPAGQHSYTGHTLTPNIEQHFNLFSSSTIVTLTHSSIQQLEPSASASTLFQKFLELNTRCLLKRHSMASCKQSWKLCLVGSERGNFVSDGLWGSSATGNSWTATKTASRVAEEAGWKRLLQGKLAGVVVSVFV
ncbi:hypothetical protein PIB30_076729 [Stylosanthes scabra]|uniref:Uncharacterized protein n=1 Tax=Stylosanthes scabra TaxID=79078 RepID=A0ABU6XNB5_9FABA|nr:hypothetical protein [Stylosanthes scabra]